MTDRRPPPPDGPGDPNDEWDTDGWNDPPSTLEHLPVVGDMNSNGPSDDEIHWGNTPEELLAESMRRLDELADHVLQLHRLVTADRDDDAGLGPGKHHRFRYERHDQKFTAAAHAELSGWVSWLVGTYHLDDKVPPCWDRHDGLAEELAALYVGWQNVWADRGPYDSGIVWHDQLHRASLRWGAWLSGTRCTTDCAADPGLDQKTHELWTDHTRAAAGGAYRLTRTRRFAPPKPPPTKKKPAHPMPLTKPASAHPRTTPPGRTAP